MNEALENKIKWSNLLTTKMKITLGHLSVGKSSEENEVVLYKVVVVLWDIKRASGDCQKLLVYIKALQWDHI